MIQVKDKFITRSGRIANVVSDTSQNFIAAMAGFSFRIQIDGKSIEEYFITDSGRKFDSIESDDDLIEKVEEVSYGDASDPFFSMTSQLANIDSRWNLHGSMLFNQTN